MGIFRFIGRALVSLSSIGVGCLFTYCIYLQYQTQVALSTTTSWTATVAFYIYCLVMAWISVACIVYGMLHREIRDHKRNLK